MSKINQLNAATDYYWLQTDPEDIVNKASALMFKLMKKALKMDNWEVQPSEYVDGGLMVKVPLKYDVSHHGVYGKNTVINQSKKDIIDAARFGWAGAYGSNTLNLEDFTQNSGAEAIVNLAKKYLEDIKTAIRVDMAGQIIGSAALSALDDSMSSLYDLFNTTTSTEYGSIAEDDISSWKANVITTSEEICFEVMQKIFRTPGFGGYMGTRPNFCCTTELLVDGYERSLHPQQRYKEDDLVEAGWDNIIHKGAPIVADPYYLTGVLDALNLRFLSLRSHKDYNFTTPEWIAKKEAGQPDTMTANTRWRGNLYCSNRQMNVRHTNLTEPA